MAKNSKIEWTHHTFNPWWGCVKVSPACEHCYAEAWARRTGLDVWGQSARRRFLSEDYWQQPAKWDREAQAARERRRVFCASMADVFEDRQDLEASRRRLWQVIASTPRLDWLLLTKRPENVTHMVPWGPHWPENVWLGATIETQAWAERRLPQLLQHAAVVRFVSCEPVLGPIDLRPWLSQPVSGRRGIDWVIVGGESGPGSRPMHPEWARGLRDQCMAARVAFHFKQWGNWRPTESDERPGVPARNLGSSRGDKITLVNVGKRVAGRLLDERTWDEFPELASRARAVGADFTERDAVLRL